MNQEFRFEEKTTNAGCLEIGQPNVHFGAGKNETNEIKASYT